MASKLLILADGALLHHRNAKAKAGSGGGVSVVLDFLKLPGAIAKQLGVETPDRASCHWFMVGSQTAAKFVETINHVWSAHEFPLKASNSTCICGATPVCFTPAIAWALGNIANAAAETTVVVVSNDPAVIFPAKFTTDRGPTKVLIGWPDALGEEARHFAERNHLPIMLIDPNEMRAPGSKPGFGRTFLSELTKAHKEDAKKNPQ